ncbi:DUF4145 domain-containing protein [Candidatus Sulfurimonas baltica]|uniref:DUF4145 domain-containing protein n=1 Tax=Candidatus Sulfurimonas baltica TaxID=2740404 RepID=A0A7S7LVY4_9BACT|nr:DUF4145 domain-containing protein [Candidatus Sulfurimonas baltica]QOY52312.1 DUF4145 domain-containing protein [Candidatus Sulfurimonas baltica]
MINRELYKGYFTHDDMSKWQCPTCNSGSLQVIQDKFLKQHNSETEINYHENWFQAPEMITYTFTALLSCTNPSCKEVVTCSGTGGVEREQYSYDDYRHVEYFKPVFFYPPLNIFQIPEKTPENVQNSIKSSFSLVFNNKSSAANQVRIAIECLLTHLKIKNYHTSGGRRNKLSLHKRIGLLPTKYQKIKDICLAIKWLGNAGSHCDDDITLDDVFNGYDMLSFVLEELYDNKHTHVTKLAKKINAKKGV